MQSNQLEKSHQKMIVSNVKKFSRRQWNRLESHFRNKTSFMSLHMRIRSILRSYISLNKLA